MVDILVGRCRCAIPWCEPCVTFDFVSASIFSKATFQTCFSYLKAIWIAVTDYYVYFYLIMRSPFTAILKLTNKLIAKYYSIITSSLKINAVILHY